MTTPQRTVTLRAPLETEVYVPNGTTDPEGRPGITVQRRRYAAGTTFAFLTCQFEGEIAPDGRRTVRRVQAVLTDPANGGMLILPAARYLALGGDPGLHSLLPLGARLERVDVEGRETPWRDQSGRPPATRADRSGLPEEKH